MNGSLFVGLDVHKKSTSVAIGESGRGGEVRFLGEIPTTPAALRRLVDKLGRPDRRLHFCYEAGPCGYEIHRLLRGLDQDCIVVAPSLIPIRPGDRVKTNRRDATALAKLRRAGELTAVWVPDNAYEADGKGLGVIWSGPEPQQGGFLAKLASIFRVSYCAMAGSTVVSEAGPKLIGAG